MPLLEPNLAVFLHELWEKNILMLQNWAFTSDLWWHTDSGCPRDAKLEESVITQMLKHLTFNNFFRKQMKNDYCRRYLGKQTTEK